MADLVKFYKGPHDSYTVDKVGANSIYFCTDKSSIIMNGTEYCSGIKNATVSGETLVIEK